MTKRRAQILLVRWVVFFVSLLPCSCVATSTLSSSVICTACILVLLMHYYAYSSCVLPTLLVLLMHSLCILLVCTPCTSCSPHAFLMHALRLHSLHFLFSSCIPYACSSCALPALLVLLMHSLCMLFVCTPCTLVILMHSLCILFVCTPCTLVINSFVIPGSSTVAPGSSTGAPSFLLHWCPLHRCLVVLILLRRAPVRVRTSPLPLVPLHQFTPPLNYTCLLHSNSCAR